LLRSRRPVHPERPEAARTEARIDRGGVDVDLPCLSDQQLELLTSVDSPTVANVIELFGIRSPVAGYANHTLRAVYPDLPPTVGYACTAALRTSHPAGAAVEYADLPRFIDASLSLPTPRLAVIQDLDEPPRAACFGEVMVASMRTFGFAGLITNGAARDVEQVRPMRFPCWASGCLVAHGFWHLEEVGAPVTVAGLQVRPGDLLHADVNGIVQIPAAIAPAVAGLCRPYLEAERIVLDYLRSDRPTPDGFRQAVERQRRRLATLAEQARGHHQGA
jgi:regulator of RNase E activity RraA